MAFVLFSKKNIDSIDVNNVPEEFINYFNGLSTERKDEIIRSRPELAEVLGYSIDTDSLNSIVLNTYDEHSPDNDKTSDEEDEEEGVFGADFDALMADQTGSKTRHDMVDVNIKRYDFSEISHNIYSGAKINSRVVNNQLDQIEALTVKGDNYRCILHRKNLEKISLKYRKFGTSYGIVVYYCSGCNRLFVSDKDSSNIIDLAREIKLPCKIYDSDLSEAYLRSQMKEIEFSDTIYTTDVWIETSPRCHIHSIELEKLPYTMKYKDRKINFTGYYCSKCNKTFLRKAAAADLEDECRKVGIPITVSALREKKPDDKILVEKKVRPDYYVDNGEKHENKDWDNVDCYKVTEKDTIVVSDSIYCNIEEHETDKVLGLVWVNQKLEGRKSYLCMLGECEECQKYYMDSEDFNVLYKAGRPEVGILNDLDEDYQITSGHVFDVEKKHLSDLEEDFDARIREIKNNPDYISQYAIGDWEDLSFKKKISREKYEPKIKKIEAHKPRPYRYRVDMVSGENKKIYYIGVDDIEDKFGNKVVISFNNDFGRELVNIRTSRIENEGIFYDIKLSREFDIDRGQLFGYTNLRTDEDLVFRKGITDPFLVKVLRTRKRQHGLVDIIATIQENQNEIVDVAMGDNIIVQGCAGSGKTMVLLHRLSSLKYKYRTFDFSAAMILTPNEDFSTHISGVAEGLQIGFIKRQSVEDYYISLLKMYSNELSPVKNKLAQEVYEVQSFVDYVYSDEFKEKFMLQYEEIISKRNQIVKLIYKTADEMQVSITEEMPTVDSKIELWIRHAHLKLEAEYSKSVRALTSAEEQVSKLKDRIAFFEKEVEDKKIIADSIVKASLPKVMKKIDDTLLRYKNNIKEQDEFINECTEEGERLKGEFWAFGRKAKLDKIKSDIENAETIKKSIQNNESMIREVLDDTIQEKDDEAILSWMKRITAYVREVMEEVQTCESIRNNYASLVEELRKNNELLVGAKELAMKERENQYSDETINDISTVGTAVRSYSVLNTCNEIFNAACADFCEKHDIIKRPGTKRYDLYARLLFAMKYYGKPVGQTRYMCIDEGQDLSLNEYNLIYDINDRNLIFNIYGDTNQLLKKGRGISNWSALRIMYKAKLFTLNENYRNTNQITRYCNNSFDMNVLQTGVDGVKVKEIPRSHLERAIASLKESDGRIAVLLPRRINKKTYLDKTMFTEVENNILEENINNGRIVIKYVDEVKGIEFDKVFVSSGYMSKNERYIAYTRALSELIVVVDTQENIA